MRLLIAFILLVSTVGQRRVVRIIPWSRAVLTVWLRAAIRRGLVSVPCDTGPILRPAH